MIPSCHKIVELNTFYAKSIIVENKYLMKTLKKMPLKH